MRVHRNPVLSLSIFLLAMTLISFPVSGAEKTDENRTVTVAFVSQDGMMEQDGEGNYAGYSYEYIMKLAQYTGWNVQFAQMDSQNANEQIVEAMNKVSNGEVDLIAGMLYSDELAKMYEYPSESYGYRFTTLIADQNNSEITSDKLVHPDQTLKVAVLKTAENRNQELSTFCETNGISYDPVFCESEDGQRDAIRNGSADVMLSISLMSYPGTKMIANFAARPYYILAQKGNKELIGEMDEALRTIQYTEPEFRDTLQTKYFGGVDTDNTLTEDERTYISAKKELQVLIPYELAPLQYTDSEGQYRGIFISFADYLASQTGTAVVLHSLEQGDTLETAMASGKYDMAIGLSQNYNYALNRKLIFSIPLVKSEVELFYNMAQDPGDLRNGTLAQIRTSAVRNEYQSAEIEFFNLEEALEAVENGKADYGYGSSLIVDYLIAEKSYQNTVSVPLVEQNKEYVVGFGKDASPKLIRIVNKVISSIDESTMNSFLQDTAYVGEHTDFYYWIRRNPLEMTAAVVLLCGLLAGLVMAAALNRQRKKENMKLILANSSKAEFFSRMSHDMRTPMNGILGIANLSRDETDPKLLKENIDKIVTSGEYLLGLINDTLDIQRIESGGLQLEPQIVHSGKVFNSILDMVRQSAEQKQIRLVVDNKNVDLDYYIHADSIRLRQIFINLISNAVKFTPDGGMITLELEELFSDERMVYDRFTVRDTGVGMSEDFIKNRIFTPFAQEYNAVSGQYAGSGLGLSIVKRLVELMDGKITVESRLGEGSAFTIYLNFEKASPQEAAKQKKKEAEKQTEERKNLKDRRILLAEDHPLNAEIATKLLEKAGCIVTRAVDGQECLEIFEKAEPEQYDLILMDVRMPRMDGLAATKAIRMLDRKDAKAIPILAMSANAYDEDVKKSLEAGMNGHLAKPVDPGRLYEVLTEMLR